ncbi:hypothetical protein MM236_04225 [Belliella sp. DSM 107340]|uniref:DUF2178 domain-containing protein n=1 Tax=Belliella calami TaxID=2923436 RepID=A0ABS9ULD1_9BACT|nr:hypothetical protein [Belliella calami]MCH7397179.1 hypothetical protein [Belliella calami]
MIPKFLLPTYFKSIGFSLFLISVLGHLIFGYFYFLFMMSMAFFGLFIIASAKEKIEDEMIQTIRLNSLQTAVFAQVLFVLGFSLFDEWRAEGLVNLPMPAVLVGIIFIGIYLIVFYYQLYFKNNEE